MKTIILFLLIGISGCSSIIDSGKVVKRRELDVLMGPEWAIDIESKQGKIYGCTTGHYFAIGQDVDVVQFPLPLKDLGVKPQ